MSDKPDPEKEMIVNGDSKTVVQGDKRHPWNQVKLPKTEPPPSYKYQLTVQHKDDDNVIIKAVCSDLEELFSYNRQFVGIDYVFIKMERIIA